MVMRRGGTRHSVPRLGPTARGSSWERCALHKLFQLCSLLSPPTSRVTRSTGPDDKGRHVSATGS